MGMNEQELKKGLEEGKEAAKRLALHLERMQGVKIEIPVVSSDGCYIITARKTLIFDKPLKTKRPFFSLR